jgi:hypothetical protein
VVVLLGTRRRWPARKRLAAAFFLFALALGVRTLHAVDLRPVMGTPDQPDVRMSHRYEAQAEAIAEGDGILFHERADASDTESIARPPGYAAFLAAVHAALGPGPAPVQSVQNGLDSAAVVVLFLIGEALLGPAVGLAGGAIAAVAPHFGFFSNVVLPDEPCVLLVLVGLWCVTLGLRVRRSIALHALGGAAFGLSVWLRPNTLALPFFLAAGIVLLRLRPRPWARAFALASTAAAVVAPITLRNYLVYGAFVPVSTNMGIVLWEGIADAGGERFGAFSADREVARDEARLLDEPRYREWWASPDGIARDRFRMRRSLAVIRANPGWFARAAVVRMGEMLDFVAAAPPLVEAGGIVRGVARALQVAVTGTFTLAAALGVLLAGALAPRRALFLSIVPLAYLLLQAPMHLEFRVTLPMHAVLALFAGAAWVAALGVARAPRGSLAR